MAYDAMRNAGWNKTGDASPGLCRNVKIESVNEKCHNYRASPDPAGDSARFVRVSERHVRFENGEQTLVPGFLIGQKSISIGEFQQFADEAGYVTRAEREGDRYNFRNHFATWEFRGPDKLLLPATYLCFEDVSAYCQWAKARLPSEAEFLAASLIDEESYPEFSDEMRRRLQAKQKSGDVIIIATLNFTSTKVSNDKVVARRGPKYFLITGWEHEAKINRQVIKQNDFSLPVEFRVVLEAEGSVL